MEVLVLFILRKPVLRSIVVMLFSFPPQCMGLHFLILTKPFAVLSEIITIPTRGRGTLRVVWFCPSSAAKDGEYFFMYSLPICTLSFERCLCISFANWLPGLFVGLSGFSVSSFVFAFFI